MMEYEVLIVKENESLVLSCMITDGETKVLDISQLTVSAVVSTLSGAILTPLEVTMTAADIGQFTCELSSGNLPANTYLVDIRFDHLESGLHVSTSTFKLKIIRGITK